MKSDEGQVVAPTSLEEALIGVVVPDPELRDCVIIDNSQSTKPRVIRTDQMRSGVLMHLKRNEG